MSHSEPTAANRDYWIRKDRARTLKDAYAKYGPGFPKIKRDAGFEALATLDNILDQVAWQLYVMALTKNLNPDAKPSFLYDVDIDADDDSKRKDCTICRLSFIGDAKIKRDAGFEALATLDNILDQVAWQLYVMALTKNLNPDAKPSFLYDVDIDADDDSKRKDCTICRLSFIGDAKDAKNEPAMHRIGGLYKLHKSADRRDVYDVCSACFYALQNPAVILDYPKGNRRDPIGRDDRHVQTFLQLKRASDLGYHGTFTVHPKYAWIEWTVHPDATYRDDEDGYTWLELTHFSG